MCHGQIDLVDWTVKQPGRKYNFCCVNDWEHYRIFFIHWESVINFIEYETAVVYEGRHKYEITQQNNETHLLIYKVDAENRVIDENEPNANFVYDKHLFDFSKTNREKIVNRVKTILVFQ